MYLDHVTTCQTYSSMASKKYFTLNEAQNMILADPDSDDNDLDMESEDDFSNVAPSDPDSDLDAYTEDENGDNSCRLYMNICIAGNDFMRLKMHILCSALHK